MAINLSEAFRRIPAEAYSRVSDPKTSDEAAADALYGAQRVSEIVLEVLEAHPAGLTMCELAGVTGLPVQAVTPRFAPLRRRGLIQAAGKRRNVSGVMATVWQEQQKP
jgi:DNA-binding IclR family transcriptional regulator